MPFKFEKLEIGGLTLITAPIFGDERGYFTEGYKFSEFKDNGIEHVFSQDGYSKSKKGVLRGLHYQLKPADQGKLIRVLTGRIFDVAVDIRKGSAHYGKWIGKELSEENGLTLFLPPGFAHGFVTLEEDTRVLYKMTKEYSKKDERGIIWNDPKIGIKWPVKSPTVAEKDQKFPTLEFAENNFVYGK